MPSESENPDDKERVTLSAKVSKESAKGWRTFCDNNGISLAAMLEVAGQELLSESMPPTVEARRNMVAAARGIDRQRRVRRRD
jgi:hypothetical protein